MRLNEDFEIRRFDFNAGLTKKLESYHYAKSFWPVVYILSENGIKKAYIGETTDTESRMNAHLRHQDKKKLTEAHIIASPSFNKSATLDIESGLIRYLFGDGQFQLLNANLGIANHSYYQKQELYNPLFRDIWNELRSKGLASKSLEAIDNSDLFKYSPYKSLSNDQKKSLQNILKAILTRGIKTSVVEGGAGTGKTILALYLFKLLLTEESLLNLREFAEEEKEILLDIKSIKRLYPNLKMGLVVPMSSLRKTLKKVFKNIHGLSPSMVIGPSDLAKEKYDIIIVDESHRLRRRVNLTNYKSFDDAAKLLGLDYMNTNELEWVHLQSDKSILFYDAKQSIKPTDVEAFHFRNLLSKKSTHIEKLISQFRVKGGNDYIKFIDQIFDGSSHAIKPWDNNGNYDFQLFDSFADFFHQIQQREKEHELSRLVAGYAWEWKSKNDKSLTDIEIEGQKLRWNSTSEDWINSLHSKEEVGCIHTTQGYDLNYTGVIFGHEIGYDAQSDEIIIRKENYHDKNGKNTIDNVEELKVYIINIYKTLMLRGILGTYVYVVDPDLREYLSQFIPVYSQEIESQEYEALMPFVNSVPLYPMEIAAGNLSDEQYLDENKVDWQLVPNRYHGNLREYFACKVVGESMNKIIPNGATCLFKAYSGGSRSGKIVLVELTDLQDIETGSKYTVKEYQSIKQRSEEGWEHQGITLFPRTNSIGFEPIKLNQDESEQLKVVAEFVCVLD